MDRVYTRFRVRRTVGGPFARRLPSLNPRFMRNGLLMLVLVMGVSALLYTWLGSSTTVKPMAYSGPGSFLADVQAGTVTKVVQQGETLSVYTKDQGANPTDPSYTVSVPNVLTQVSQDIAAAAAAGGVPQPTFDPKPAPDNSWIGLVLTGPAAADHHRRLHLLHDAAGPGDE